MYPPVLEIGATDSAPICPKNSRCIDPNVRSNALYPDSLERWLLIWNVISARIRGSLHRSRRLRSNTNARMCRPSSRLVGSTPLLSWRSTSENACLYPKYLFSTSTTFDVKSEPGSEISWS